ncbi:MAG TPA: amidohydrolase [Bryobacteraceae bacterium]|jgi:5-methylthioadenosine/S-adenosylhomocysteine deaminase
MHLFYKCLPALLSIAAQAFAVEPADWIIRARYVVTMDPQHRVIEQGAVAIRGPRIAGVGTQSEIARLFRAKHSLARPDALVAPGLIDTHTHAPMSLLRAIADDKRLEDWLNKYIFPAESKNVSPDFVRWGTRLACLEMVLAGITTYTDMYYFEDVEAEAAKEAGVRAVLGQTIIGFPAPDYKTWRQAIAGAERFIQKYRNDDLIVPAVAPHAIYTTPDEALVAAHQLATKYHVPLTIHLSETHKERDDAVAKRHMTPTQLLEKLDVLDGSVIAAHSIWEDDNDLQILKRHRVGVAYCPSSNMKLASGIAPVVEMLKLGIPVGFGNDGFAGSNDSADLIREMNLGSKLQKVTRMDPTVIPAEQALEMATVGGARVLRLNKEIGSLEAGKRADLITMSLARANTKPLYNIYSTIVYAARAGDVQDVFINGRRIVSNRHVLTLNESDIYRKAEEYKKNVLASLRQ